MLLDALFPVACPGCRRLGARRICLACWERRPAIPTGACPGCLGPCPCQSCLAEGAVDRVVALGAYDALLRQAVRLLKFHDRPDLARFLGQELAREVARELSRTEARAVVWVPVPSHRRRVRHRGYDHATLIAAWGARAAGGRCSRILWRSRETPPLYRLSRAERERALAGAFDALGTAPERVLLVDDLLTTGATSAAASACLKRAGARRVSLAVVARA